MDTSIREVTTVATLKEKKKLRKDLRLFDLVFFSAAAIIGVDTLGAVSSNGGQALTWLVFSAITFLIPYGLLTAELGSTFTQEGGLYEWCKLAGGRFYAALVTTLYWISNPLWLGGTMAVTVIIAIKTLWFGNAQILFGGSVLADAIVSTLIALIFIWGTMLCAIVSLHSGKWLSTYGMYVKLGLFALFIVLAIAYAFSGHASGAHITFGDLIPSSSILAIVTGILPVLVFNWSGFEVQNGAGEEMHNPQRDVPQSIVRSGLVTVVTYCVVIGVILFTLPKSQLVSATGFLAAFQLIVGILPGPLATVMGWLVALAIAVSLASIGGTWIMGADRMYAISALDRTAPALLGRFSSKHGTPIVVNLITGSIATITVVVSIVLTARVGGTTSTLFNVALGFILSITAVIYLLIFPVFLVLRYRYPNLHRPFKVPGGIAGAWIVTLLPMIYAAFASYFALIPPDATVSASGLPRSTYELALFIPCIIIVLLTVVFYIWGHLEKRNKDVLVELHFTQEGTSEAVANVTTSDQSFL